MADAADVARMREIIARLRSDYDVEVLELPGWTARGKTWTRIPCLIFDHHDASSVKSGEWGSLGVIRDGRPDVPGPLSQFQIARCLDGRARLAVVAAGRANHAGKGGPLRMVPEDSANAWAYGAESANDGVAEPYTAAAGWAHDALFRVVSDVCGFSAAGVIGHKEWAPGRKSDPRYSMVWRRAGVDLIRPLRRPVERPTVTETTSRRDNMVQIVPIETGTSGARIVLPVGPGVVVTERAWLSFAVNGPDEGWVRLWFQHRDGSGLSDVGSDIRFADGASEVVGWELPSGTATVAMQWHMPTGGTYTIETLARR